MAAYWRRVFVRAGEETARSLGFGSLRRIALNAFIFVLAVLALRLLWGGNQMSDELRWGASIGVIVLAMFLPLFVYKLFTVPPKLAREAASAFESWRNRLHEKIEGLKKQLEPKLDITGPFRKIIGDSTVEKVVWVFLVGVENASSQEITKCEPQILVSDPTGNEFFGGEHPLNVDGQPINFDLSPHQNKKIRVASFHPEDAGARIHINLAEGRWKNDLPTNSDYRVRIKVYARDTTPAERDFKLFYDNEGLNFVDITKAGGLED